MTTKAPLVIPPLYGTARSPGRPTLGARISEAAARLGKPLMPHQQHIVDVVGEVDPDTGLLAYSEVVVIGPRQATGKTELLLPVMTHRCTGFDDRMAAWSRRTFGKSAWEVPDPGPQRVLYTAQTADNAREKWRDVHLKRLQSSPYKRDFEERLQRNMEAFIWRNGSTWSPASTTGRTAGTGDTVDMTVIDEAWSQPDNRTELGLRPAMMTRRWRQLWVMSMIPGLSRAAPGTWSYLAAKRKLGRARVEAGVTRGMAFFDFSAPDGLDPADPATWWTCMPGLGRTVTERAVREDFDAMPLVDFCAEYLGWEPLVSVPQWSLIRETTWEGLHDPESAVSGWPALSVEMAEDRSRGVIGVSGRRKDGNWHVAVAEPGYLIPEGTPGVEWILPRLLDLVVEADASCVVIDPRRPANSLIVPLRNRGIKVITPNQQEVAGACGRFYDATGEQVPDTPADGEEAADPSRVRHLGQRGVARALGVARKLELSAGAFTIVGRGTSADLIDLYAVILAMHGAELMDMGEWGDSVDWSQPCDRCGRQKYWHDGSQCWLHCEDDSPGC